MSQPDPKSLEGLTLRVESLERRGDETRERLRGVTAAVAAVDHRIDRIDTRLTNLEAAALHQQEMLDGIAETQTNHGLLLVEILRRLPEPTDGAE
jgi:chromosome segregation ATPase